MHNLTHRKPTVIHIEQTKFSEAVIAALAEYVKEPTPKELGIWWGTCRTYSLHDVQRALIEHAGDPELGNRAPRPIDIKRRIARTGRPSGISPLAEGYEAPPRNEAYYLACISSPSVRRTAHAIALKHGNRPWHRGANFTLPAPLEHMRGRLEAQADTPPNDAGSITEEDLWSA